MQFPQVGFHAVGDPESPGEDVSLGVHCRFFFGDLAVAHPLFGQAVIGCDLHKLAFGEQVGP